MPTMRAFGGLRLPGFCSRPGGCFDPTISIVFCERQKSTEYLGTEVVEKDRQVEWLVTVDMKQDCSRNFPFDTRTTKGLTWLDTICPDGNY